MTEGDAASMDSPSPAPEGALAARVLDALLREDYAGMRGLVRAGTLLLPGRPVRLVAACPPFLSEVEVDRRRA